MTPPDRHAGIVVACLALFALGAALLWPREDRLPDLDASPVGFDGLAIWLREGGAVARTYDGWGRFHTDDLGLRILPVFDAVLDEDRAPPATQEEVIAQQSERDADGDLLLWKMKQYPTLLIMPKWRTGMRLLHAAHPDLLIDEALLNAAAFTTLHGGTDLRRVKTGAIAAHDGDPSLTPLIHHPQVMKAGADCTPIIGTRDAMVLGECRFGLNKNRRGAVSYWVLSDPDLLNNHGLSQGDNAAIAAQLFAQIADGGDIIIDETDESWTLVEDTPRERSWSDLARFFGPPFLALWAGLAMLAVLMLWRGAVRHGAPLPDPDAGPGAAKAVAVDATARLLRLSGHDGALLAAWAEQRLARAATQVLGPHRKMTADPGAQLVAWLGRRDAPAARSLQDAIAGIRAAPTDAGGPGALRLLDEFERQLEQVLYDAGRTVGRR